MSTDTDTGTSEATGDVSGDGTAPSGRRRSLPPVLSKAPPVAMVIFGASGDLTHR